MVRSSRESDPSNGSDVSGGDALDTGRSAESVVQRIEKGDRPHVLAVSSGGQRHRGDRELRRLEAGRHVDEIVEADDEESRASQEHERQRELGDNARRTQPPRPDASTAAARLFVQRHADALVGRDERRHHTEYQAGDRGQQKRRTQHPHVDGDAIDAWKPRELRRNQGSKRCEAPRGPPADPLRRR